MKGVRERPPHSPRTHTSPKHPLPGLVENVQSTTWGILESPAALSPFVYLILRVQRRASLRICVMRFCKQPPGLCWARIRKQGENDSKTTVDSYHLPEMWVLGIAWRTSRLAPALLESHARQLCVSPIQTAPSQHTDFKFERRYTLRQEKK